MFKIGRMSDLLRRVQCFVDPIAKIWKILKNHVQNESRSRNRGKMIETMQRVWEGVSMDKFEVLVSTMPHIMSDP